ncbi:leucine-rich repeat domain-containing protein [Lachnospiraceae bacterium ZAX-1]
MSQHAGEDKMEKIYKLRIISALIAITFAIILYPGITGYAADPEEFDPEGFRIEGDVLTGYNGAGGYIIIPSSVRSIQDNIFSGRTEITGVEIPGSVTNIGSYSFAGCSSLQRVSIASPAVTIGTGVFSKCSSLTSVSLPEGLTSIAAEMFQECGALSEVMIPSTVNSIGSAAFRDCGSLPSIAIPSGVATIGSGAFMGCYNLSSVSGPAAVSNMGTGVYSGCSNLSSVNLGGATSIPELTFYACVSLNSLDIPTSVGNIGASAFENSGITNMAIPSGATVDLSAFDGCTSLVSIDVKGVGGNYASSDGALYNTSLTVLLYCPIGKTSIKLADTTEELGPQSFTDCAYISNLTLGKSVKKISASAFTNSGIKAVTIPETVTDIGSQSSWIPDVIYGFTGSQAEKFADANNYIFESIGTVPGTPDVDRKAVLEDFGTFTGSGELSAIVDADDITFVRLLLKGKEVKSSNYEITSGSTIITLNEVYMKTLANGTYAFIAEFSDGNSEEIELIVDVNSSGGNTSPGNGGTNGGNTGTNTGGGTGGGSTAGNSGSATSVYGKAVRVKDSSPKTGAGLNAGLFLCGSLLMLGCYLVITKKKDV